jgi:NAD(P)-dependent dehydrogenase (short-subunit alcohol dehydrogenase family)
MVISHAEAEMQEFENRVAIVTGAATGNGESIARRLFAGGASVVVVGHDKQGLDTLVRSIDPSSGRSRAIEADVRDAEGMRYAVQTALDTFGALHLAVNNAGLPRYSHQLHWAGIRCHAPHATNARRSSRRDRESSPTGTSRHA